MLKHVSIFIVLIVFFVVVMSSLKLAYGLSINSKDPTSKSIIELTLNQYPNSDLYNCLNSKEIEKGYELSIKIIQEQPSKGATIVIDLSEYILKGEKSEPRISEIETIPSSMHIIQCARFWNGTGLGIECKLYKDIRSVSIKYRVTLKCDAYCNNSRILSYPILKTAIVVDYPLTFISTIEKSFILCKCNSTISPPPSPPEPAICKNCFIKMTEDQYMRNKSVGQRMTLQSEVNSVMHHLSECCIFHVDDMNTKSNHSVGCFSFEHPYHWIFKNSSVAEDNQELFFTFPEQGDYFMTCCSSTPYDQGIIVISVEGLNAFTRLSFVCPIEPVANISYSDMITAITPFGFSLTTTFQNIAVPTHKIASFNVSSVRCPVGQCLNLSSNNPLVCSIENCVKNQSNVNFVIPMSVSGDNWVVTLDNVCCCYNNTRIKSSQCNCFAPSFNSCDTYCGDCATNPASFSPFLSSFPLPSIVSTNILSRSTNAFYSDVITQYATMEYNQCSSNSQCNSMPNCCCCQYQNAQLCFDVDDCTQYLGGCINNTLYEITDLTVDCMGNDPLTTTMFSVSSLDNQVITSVTIASCILFPGSFYCAYPIMITSVSPDYTCTLQNLNCTSYLACVNVCSLKSGSMGSSSILLTSSSEYPTGIQQNVTVFLPDKCIHSSNTVIIYCTNTLSLPRQLNVYTSSQVQSFDVSTSIMQPQYTLSIGTCRIDQRILTANVNVSATTNSMIVTQISFRLLLYTTNYLMMVPINSNNYTCKSYGLELNSVSCELVPNTTGVAILELELRTFSINADSNLRMYNGSTGRAICLQHLCH